jgi:hypothetical protein
VFSWTINNVCLWVEKSLNLKKLVPNFKSAGVDGAELYELVEEDVEGRLNITAKGQKKKVWNAIKKLKFSQAEKEAKKEAKKTGGKVKVAVEKSSNVGKKKAKEVRAAQIEPSICPAPLR